MAADMLFNYIEKRQGERPWGRVLDAGTGDHSLRWIRKLPTTGWTAVTVDPIRIKNMLPKLSPTMRDTDQLLLGDWQDEQLLEGEQFDVVLVDYLIGAIDAFTPFYQTSILERLRPHVRGQLYLIGWEPFDESATHPAHKLIVELAKTKDACRLLANKRPYREYPASWVKREFERSGYVVNSTEHFTNIFHARYVESQTQACHRALEKVENDAVSDALSAHVEQLKTALMPYAKSSKGIRFGADYIICASPK
ncbi:MAG TPA: hypothetical protein DCE42_13960 [Myxococcales bacterium]|nr:hypothetical protein [Deltaproteobacteria bacterium]MBU50958.1 hypothetical protein [Deltaproteobacteria bacterium]HAA55863.1 hypothetical protein [Myxococcales bacterium]